VRRNCLSKLLFCLTPLAAVVVACSPESSGTSPPIGTTWVCFDLRTGAPLQSGFDFYGYFLKDGRFLPGVVDVQFNSGSALVAVELAGELDGRSWVASLPNEVLDDPVLNRWYLSDDSC